MTWSEFSPCRQRDGSIARKGVQNEMKSMRKERKNDMKKGYVVLRCCAVMALGVLCGCETVVLPPEPKHDARQGDPAEPFFGRTPDVTMYGLESSASQLMADMKANAEFQRNYKMKTKKAKKNTRPTVIVGDIKNFTENPVQDRLDIVRNTVVRTELLNSGLFTILPKDAESSPDYVVNGSFNDVPESDGRHNHYLHIRVMDFKTDAIVWEGFRKNVKL